MNEKKEICLLTEALDRANIECAELLQSREFLLGKRLIAFWKAIKTANFKEVVKILKKKFARVKIKEIHFLNKKNDIPQFGLIDTSVLVEKKIAVYTCITGNYDPLNEPVIKYPNVDFFVYSEKQRKSENWTYRPIPPNIMRMGNVLANRYIKFHPKELFTNYDFAVYVDGNVKVVADIRRLVKCTQVLSGIAMFDHCLRDCLYDEAEACSQYGKGNRQYIAKQVKNYMSRKFPPHFGLKEATVIFSDLNNSNSPKFFEKWWEELCESKSMRDQLALPYSIWSAGFDMSSIGSLGDNVYLNQFFRVYSH